MKRVEVHRCPSLSHQQPHPNRTPYKAYKQTSIYLLKTLTSCHSNHTKKAIPFSLFLRIRHIRSPDTFFDQRSRELIDYLTKCGYSRTLLQRDGSLNSTSRNLSPEKQKSAKTDRTPLVISLTLRFLNYHLLLTSIPLSFQLLPNAKSLTLTHQ